MAISTARLQPSLGSMIRRASGAACATAARHAAGSRASSLTFSRGAPATASAARRMASGVFRLMVTAVAIGPGASRPRRSATEPPPRRASRSHSAQSRALRAAPAGSAASTSVTGLPFRNRSPAAASRAATPSRVSP